MALSDLIPAECFEVPAAAIVDAANEAKVNGTITVRNQEPFKGGLIVQWDRKCKSFAKNLEGCRTLKNAGHGTYRPDFGGWLFNPLAVTAVIAALPDLFHAPEVLALASVPVSEVTASAVAPVASVKATTHGTINLENGQWSVVFGGDNHTITRQQFGIYLESSRSIKSAFPKSRGWNAVKKCWNFDLSAATRIINAFPSPFFEHSADLLSSVIPEVVVPTQSNEDLDFAAVQLMDAAMDILEGTLPSGRVLFPHQIDAVKWLVSCRTRTANGNRLKGCILADDMGLGKTTSALVAAYAHKTVGESVKIHVTCPKSLISNWKNEANQVGVHIDGITSNHVASMPSALKMTDPFVLIVDEAHAFQNLESARTVALLQLVASPLCEAVYLLSGTPIKNGRPINLLPLLMAVNHGIAVGKTAEREYKFKFCGAHQVPTPRGMVWSFDGATNLQELHQLIQPSILRRLKKDCINLPEKIRSLIPADVSAADEQNYQETLVRCREEYLARLRAGTIKPGADALIVLTRLRRAGSIAKVTSSIEWAEEVLEQNGQAAIFTAFAESATAIAAHFGIKAYTGETSATDRTRLVDDFQSCKSKVFVGTIGAGGVGINLHAFGACRDVLLVDRPWTPGDAAQVEDRCHRIGQTGTVNAGWLQYGTVDTTVDNLLVSKSENVEEVLAGERKGLSFSQTDLAGAVVDALGW